MSEKLHEFEITIGVSLWLDYSKIDPAKVEIAAKKSLRRFVWVMRFARLLGLDVRSEREEEK